MRSTTSIFLIFLTLVLAILVAGCTQQAPPATPATPAPTVPPVETIPDTTPIQTAVVPVAKRIDLAVVQDGSDILVKFRGGADAGDLAALKITIEDYSMQPRTEREDNPVINQQYVFPQMGTANPDLVTVVGVFRDGTEQTLFQKKL